MMNVVEFNSLSDKTPGRNTPGQRQVPKPQVQGTGERIMVVDDQQAWLEVAHTILSAAGYRVTVCEHPPDAVSLLKESPDQIGLVITDLNMPYLDGFELAAELLKINAAVPIVLTSADLVGLDSALLQTLGIRDFVPKSWEPDWLLSAVRQVLASTRTDEKN
jgi:CheY-like chemotaxis protein